MKANLLSTSFNGLTGLVCLDKNGDRSANYEILNKDNYQYNGVGGWNTQLVPALGKINTHCSTSYLIVSILSYRILSYLSYRIFYRILSCLIRFIADIYFFLVSSLFISYLFLPSCASGDDHVAWEQQCSACDDCWSTRGAAGAAIHSSSLPLLDGVDIRCLLHHRVSNVKCHLSTIMMIPMHQF